jgi:prepilin peptidase CpaA
LVATLLIMSILAIAIVTDLQQQKIPNWLTFPAMICGMLYGTVMQGAQGFFFSFLGLGAGIGLLLLPYAITGMGAGDVKLMGAIGSFLGAQNVLWACLLSCIVGMVYAIIILLFKKSIKSYFSRYWLIIKMLLITGKLSYIPPSTGEKSHKLSYALPIALGTIFFILGNDLNLRKYLP